MQAEAARARAVRQLRQRLGLEAAELLLAAAELRFDAEHDPGVPASLPSTEHRPDLRAAKEAALRAVARLCAGRTTADSRSARVEERPDADNDSTTVLVPKGLDTDAEPQKIKTAVLSRVLQRLPDGHPRQDALKLVWRALTRYRALGLWDAAAVASQPTRAALYAGFARAREGGAVVEAFASMFDASLPRYHGLFPDIEAPFGCEPRTFFATEPARFGGMVVCDPPPAVAGAFRSKCQIVMDYNDAVTFVCALPASSPELPALLRSPYLRHSVTLPAARLPLNGGEDTALLLIASRELSPSLAADLLSYLPAGDFAPVRERVRNGVLLDLTMPRKKSPEYLARLTDDVIAHVPFPYADTITTEQEVRAQFAALRRYRNPPDARGVFAYSAEDYQINRLTDYFTDRCRYACSVKGSPSPLDLYRDPAFMRRLLRPLSAVSSAVLRERLWRAARECTLFKSTLTAAVLRHFGVGGGAGRVLDISAGWGDRMLGALAAGAARYTAFDPNRCLRPGHDRIRRMFDAGGIATVHYEPFESAAPRLVLEAGGRGAYELVFSSPPYFDLEDYDGGSEQSHRRHTGFEAWLHNFLFKSLEICAEALAPGGNMVIHIDDTGHAVKAPMKAFVTSLPGMRHAGSLYTGGDKGKLRPMHWFAKAAA